MNRELQQVLAEAGAMMLRAAEPHVTAKAGHGNFVTETDVAVQAFLEERLAAMYPGVRFLAEEGEAAALTDTPTLIIDPIDGTTNFFRHRRCSVISVGLTEHRKAVMGAIWDPYHDALYYAERGKGAWRNGERLRVSEVPLDNALVLLGTSPYYPELMALTGRSVAELLPHIADFRRSGSAARDLTEIASGLAEASFEWRLQPWDYCAGSVLVEEAGGRCGRITGGELTFEPDQPFMAASAAVFDGLQALLNGIARG